MPQNTTTDYCELVLWTDESLLVLNKPPGLRVLPDGYDRTLPHLRTLLEPHWGKLWIVHRLDRGTSGIMLLARSAAAHQSLNTQFENHRVTKTYHAFVSGNPAWQEIQSALPLRTNGDRRHRTVVDLEHGKKAETSFAVLERFHKAALVKAQPRSGRTHQIRAHLKALGHPLAADELYGGGKKFGPLSRPALHAFSLNFTHPVSGEMLFFKAPYPADFSAALQDLLSSRDGL